MSTGPSTGANVSERKSAPPSLAISTVIFALRSDSKRAQPALWVPLVRRVREPYLGKWALPGGALAHDQTLAEAALANLESTAGVTPTYLEQLYAFGGIHRGPASMAVPRVVSIVYWALISDAEAAVSGQRKNVGWFPADQVTDLAFDHQEIIEYALWRLRNKVEYGSVAYRFLGERFTLAQVQHVYESILGTRLDPANFRRQLKATASIEATDDFLQGGKHRPPRLYRYIGNTETTTGTSQ